jgi:tetratricopeptide repeat protein
MRTLLLAVLLTLAFPASAQLGPDNARRTISAIEAALRQRPDDPSLYFYLARFQAQLGNKDAAIAALEKVAALGDGFLPPRDAAFENIWNDAKFQEVRARLESKLPRLDYAPTAIELEDRTLIPEGIAYDPHSQSFFLGSIAQAKIVRIGWGNAVTEFAGKEAGLDAVLGLAVDAPRRILYAVSTSALTEEGHKRRRNAVVAFDVDSGRMLRRIEVPGAMQLNDVTVALGGRVFASDSGSGAIYEIPKEGAARLVVPAGQVPGSNGLAASPDVKRLYVAHSTGLAVVDPASGAVTRLANTTRENIAAIDGLYEYQGDLIGVQNATTPGRVIAITLSKDGDTVMRVRTLLSHHHNALDEPTTGAVTERGFFLLAATGVSRYNARGFLDNPDTLPKPTVLRVLLPR